MNHDEPPPSVSSSAMRTFDHENLHIGATADAETLGGQTNHRSIINPMATDIYNQDGFVDGAQSMSFSGRLGFTNSYGYGDGVQPPSIGAVRQIVVSQPSGGGDQYAHDQPPSYNDVGRREASQTGPSFTGNPVPGSEGIAGMSLTAPNFKMFLPNAFLKDNNEN